jgi:hypothetical protein
VRVLDEQRVGGFDTVVLEADDAQALGDWLNHYGYATDSELAPWLDPYVKKNWKITAFKIVQDPRSGKPIKTVPVRMSFETDKPFFPYREPSNHTGKERGRSTDQRKFNATRSLRVFLLAEQRMSGDLAASPWEASVFWADHVNERVRTQLGKELGIAEKNSIPANAWLTAFNDSAARRRDADVFFEPSIAQDTVRPAPIVIPWVFPADLIVLGGVVAFLVLRRLFKAKPA